MLCVHGDGRGKPCSYGDGDINGQSLDANPNSNAYSNPDSIAFSDGDRPAANAHRPAIAEWRF